MTLTTHKLDPPRPAMRRHTTRHAFQAPTSIRNQQLADKDKTLTTLYLGIAALDGPNNTLELGVASHDGTYSIDFHASTFDLQPSPSASEADSNTSTPPNGKASESSPNGSISVTKEDLPAYLADFLIEKLRDYEKEHLYKYVGAGINRRAHEISPQLASLLWQELDIVPLVLENDPAPVQLHDNRDGQDILVDEEADSMARKALMRFGPSHQPRLVVSTKRNKVEVDCEGRAQLAVKEDYKATVNPDTTWKATLQYAESLKANKVQIAFFNSTPQGGGVALMRHALIRFLRTLEVDASWYVPKPKPQVFRITKNNHNILQDVASKDAPRLGKDEIDTLDTWARQNAERYWTSQGGPLAPRSKGGAHLIIVDDPQMPILVQIAKEQDPSRPVIFRSHIQVRADLADQDGSPQSEVWNWIWSNVKQADLFISHPVREFVPKTVPPAKVGYLPATTDWLDGLNKKMSDWDNEYYMHEFKTSCFRDRMATLAYPDRNYMVQIARFDPAKGIPDVLAAYAHLRRSYMKDWAPNETPQLVIAGHGAVDDTDTLRIYEETLAALSSTYKDIKHDVVVMRVGPTDQILNALLSCAHVALQLSTREGFEVKVSEALHKGTPLVATHAGGIPLQVAHGKSGFLVQPGDYEAVARHLFTLFADQEVYARMANYAAEHVSDEVGTVGNALGWLYLADVLSKGEEVRAESRWVNDLAREGVGLGYREGEARLPRSRSLDLRGEEGRGEEGRGEGV